MTERFLRLTDGTPTTIDDPERGVWYAIGCGYWTDDWTKLKTFGPGIPCCPGCGCPGMQSEYRIWIDSAQRFEASGNERYLEYVLQSKEQCGGRGFDFLAAYDKWKGELP